MPVLPGDLLVTKDITRRSYTYLGNPSGNGWRSKANGQEGIREAPHDEKVPVWKICPEAADCTRPLESIGESKPAVSRRVGPQDYIHMPFMPRHSLVSFSFSRLPVENYRFSTGYEREALHCISRSWRLVIRGVSSLQSAGRGWANRKLSDWRSQQLFATPHFALPISLVASRPHTGENGQSDVPNFIGL